MALSDIACRSAKARERAYKLFDAKGLYLLVQPSGSRLWRLKYRVAGREKLLAIGGYPEVSLRAARERRDQARALLDAGTDPSAEKKRRKVAAAAATLDSFERIARAWHLARAASLAPRYAGQIMDRLEADVFPAIGALPIRTIGPPAVLELVRRIEARGAREMAHRVRMHVSDVFVWAIASGLAEQDPAAVIRKALQPTNGRLRPALIKLPELRRVLTATEALPGVWWSTRLASRLLALTAARPGVVRLAERQEFEDLEGSQPVWRVPAAKMKLTRERKRDAAFEFVMPLSSQAAAVARVAIAASPACRSATGADWLFPGAGSWLKPISDSTLSKHYREAGFAGRHVPHGWRASFSTLMNERAATEDRERDRAIIDLMLAHVPEGVEAAYKPRRVPAAAARAGAGVGRPADRGAAGARGAGAGGAAPTRAGGRT